LRLAVPVEVLALGSGPTFRSNIRRWARDSI
jgi:hypothetical protein